MSLAETTPDGPHGLTLAIIIIVVLLCVAVLGIFIFFIHFWKRRSPNRVRLTDVDGGPFQGIPLQDLSSANDGEAAPSTAHNGETPPRSRNLRFSLTGLPRRRSVNERTRGLSSNPPSREDLRTAQNALNQSTAEPDIQEEPPVAKAGPSTQPSTLASQLQPEPYQGLRRNSRLDDSRRHGMRFDYAGNNDGSANGVFGIETLSAVREYPELVVEQGAVTESPSAGTVGRSTQHYDEVVEGDPTPGLATTSYGRHDIGGERSERLTLISHGQNDGRDNDTPNQGDENEDLFNQIAYTSPVSGDGARVSFRSRQHLIAERDQSIRERGDDSGPQARRLTDDPNGLYTSFSRDYTNASLVPAPLSVGVRRSNTVYEASTQQPTASARVGNRRVSAADARPAEPDPEILIPRPQSFRLYGWPAPREDDASMSADENTAMRQARWWVPPTDAVIEQSRQIQEQREWEAEAGKVVLQRARDAGQPRPSDDEVAKRVRLMYQRSSRFRLPQTTYRPPTPPQRASRDGHADGFYAASYRDHTANHLEPAYASSQVLPFAASTISIPAQDGSRSDSHSSSRRAAYSSVAIVSRDSSRSGSPTPAPSLPATDLSSTIVSHDGSRRVLLSHRLVTPVCQLRHVAAVIAVTRTPIKTVALKYLEKDREEEV
ncbi:hypothetical protein F4802DRAFT_617629 [Xylaria palmicola]|nr:hypothetical protein F4802DRAFT_617629 [Xylaria palmicola]